MNFSLSFLRQASAPELAYRLAETLFVRKARRFARSRKLPFTVPDIPESQIDGLQRPEIKPGNGVGNSSLTEAMVPQYPDTWKDAFVADIKPDNDIDIQSVWEPARLQHVSAMIVRAWGTEDPQKATILRVAQGTVLEWVDSNQFLFGPHYMSAMECGLRIPVFFYCLEGLNNPVGDERLRLLTAIYEHAWWISQRLSLYSTIGNYTVAEAVGLIFAGGIFSNSKEGKAWLDRGVQLLREELSHQILSDGGPVEQSLNYHRFVLDLYWLAADFMEKNGLGEFSSWETRLAKGERFLKAFEDESGNCPSIGDSDDGHAVAPGVHPKRVGDDVVETRPCVTFPESGYTVIRGASGLVLAFDHGPLGMSPLFNHGHADALSITLSVGGEQIVVDTGTYRYNGVSQWRRYFRGTRAHNTVTIDGKDQADQETEFVWSHPYTAKLIRCSNSSVNPYIEATHDGYTRLREPVTHRRVIDVCSDSLFLVKDFFTGKGLHKFELNFHIHPDATLLWKEAYSVIRKGDVELSIALLGGKQFRMACGETTPPFGWYAPRYGVKVQTPVLSCQVQGTPEETSFVTAVSLGRDAPDIDGLEEITKG